MALDLYVGTLTRYYGSDRQAAPDDDTRTAVLMWRDGLSLALQAHLEEPLDWDESAAAPYFSAELGWSAYAGLLLWAAYAEHPELPRPQAVVAQWEADAAFRASNRTGSSSRYGHLLYGPELWLPCSFGFTFHAEDACGEDTCIGSSPALLAELQALNAATWRADAATLRNWRQAGPPQGEAGLEACARFGLAVFSSLAEWSATNSLPMVLEYGSD